MAGLVAAIHDFLASSNKDVDARDKPGHDGEKVTQPSSLLPLWEKVARSAG
jgi:hypothetical protein